MPRFHLSLDAVIFDLDGVLINSEPLWRRALKEILIARGVPADQDLSQTRGMQIDEVVQFWGERYPLRATSNQEVVAEVMEQMHHLVETEGEPLPGVGQAIELFSSLALQMSVASSSRLSLIERAVAALGLQGAFHSLHSAEHEAAGKPAPDVYLTACSHLNVPPNRALAIEDSLHGMQSAKRAGMRCIGIPEQGFESTKMNSTADVILTSLEELTPELLQRNFS